MPCKKNDVDTQTRSVPDKWDATRIPSLKGKVAIVTGANSGIGFVTTLELARHGADVVLACRNPERSATAVEAIREEIKGDARHGQLEEIKLDTSSQSSVKTFSDEFLKRHQKLDILVNNAGAMGFPYKITVDGFDTRTASLMNTLKLSPSARVVCVSSGMHHSAKYTPGQLFMPESKHNETTVYGTSKLYNLFFAFELGRQLESAAFSNITSVACHPRATDSNLLSNAENHEIFLKRWKPRDFPRALDLQLHERDVDSINRNVCFTHSVCCCGSRSEKWRFLRPGWFCCDERLPVTAEPAEIARSREAARDVWATTESLLDFKFKVE